MNTRQQQRAVDGEYNRNGYDVWVGGRLVYAAGNHVQDSTHTPRASRTGCR